MEKEITFFINRILDKQYSLEDKLDVDSIIFIKLVVALECKFNFEFEEEKLIITSFPKILDIVNYVMNNATISK